MRLYNGRNKIINLIDDKSIKPFNYAHNAKFESDEYVGAQDFEPEKYDKVEESKQKIGERIGERVKLRRQKSDELNKMITENNKIISKKLLRNYFQLQSLSDTQKNCIKEGIHKKIKN